MRGRSEQENKRNINPSCTLADALARQGTPHRTRQPTAVPPNSEHCPGRLGLEINENGQGGGGDDHGRHQAEEVVVAICQIKIASIVTAGGGHDAHPERSMTCDGNKDGRGAAYAKSGVGGSPFRVSTTRHFRLIGWHRALGSKDRAPFNRYSRRDPSRRGNPSFLPPGKKA